MIRNTPSVTLNPIPSNSVTRTWWEALISQYSGTPDQSIRDIELDLAFLFATPHPTLSIIHGPLLINSLRVPDERARVHPAVIFAALALATLMRSSSVEFGTSGPARALWLRDAASFHLETTLKAGDACAQLAQAALLLALFEASAHPLASVNREVTSLYTLDHTIALAKILAADINDGASMFPLRMAPSVTPPAPPRSSSLLSNGPSNGFPRSERSAPSSNSLHIGVGTGSVAHSASLYRSPPESPDCSSFVHHPMLSTPTTCTCSHTSNLGVHAWQGWELAAGRNPDQIRSEEARRTVWAALGLAAAHAVRCVVFDMEIHALRILHPSNYALLFPNEVLDRGIGPYAGASSKDGVWALYARATLLFTSCALHLYTPASGSTAIDPPLSHAARSQFALEAWKEAQLIGTALVRHACKPDPTMVYTTREYLFHSQKLVAWVFKQTETVDPKAPPGRRYADEWYFYQKQVAERVSALDGMVKDPLVHGFSRRPWQSTWFATQVTICVQLWRQDTSLTQALQLAIKFLAPCDILDALWPSPFHRSRTNALRRALEHSCRIAGLPSPPPIVSVLPATLRQVSATVSSSADLCRPPVESA